MNKQEFILKLKVELLGLPQMEIDDIVRDQEEFIREAMASGRSESDVIASLGSPLELARNLKAEIKIEKAQDEKALPAKFKGIFGALFAVLLLAPFNLIFFLGPYLGLLGTLLAGWVVAIVIAAVFICALVVFFGFIVFVPANIFAHIAIFFSFLGGAGLGLAAIGVMYFISQLVAQLTLKYLRWNLNFIQKQA